jgi:hypothetical protein
MRGNNLKIDINKDFLKEYKDNFYKGFSVTELVHIIAGLCVSAVIMFICVKIFQIDIVMSVYISVPFAAPVILAGIYRYQEYMKPKDYLFEKQYTQASERIHYETDEPDSDRFFTMHHCEKKEGNINNKINLMRKKV